MIKFALLLAAVGTAFAIEVFVLADDEALRTAGPAALAPTPLDFPEGITDLFDGPQEDGARQALPTECTPVRSREGTDAGGNVYCGEL